MAIAFRLALTLLVFVPTSDSQRIVNVQQSAASYRNFKTYKSHRLLSPSSLNVTTLVNSPSHCAITCMHLPWCVSYNFGKTSDNGCGKYTCEALSVDKYSNSEDFQSSQDFDHFSIMVSRLSAAKQLVNKPIVLAYLVYFHINWIIIYISQMPCHTRQFFFQLATQRSPLRDKLQKKKLRCDIPLFCSLQQKENCETSSIEPSAISCP